MLLAQDEYKVEWYLSFSSPRAHDEVPLKDIRFQECEAQLYQSHEKSANEVEQDAFPRHDEIPDLDSPSHMQGMASGGQAQEVLDDQVPIRDVQPEVATNDQIELQKTSEHTPLPLQEPEEPFSPDSDPDPLHLVDPWDFLLAHPEGLPHPNSEPHTDLRLGSLDFESESSLGLGPGKAILFRR
ncbi:hypothetical protein ARMSODRAFT_303381 [Armillaria solidipes]|uniref:Uncharacterized protein n=1 Tax=Armillaria solidipes TaxID=1076256 RepID=A0A2H3BAH3_9AGAR|nr:hypothetical protein ARMSODRAFT_303381 [Armillaria solidipes]